MNVENKVGLLGLKGRMRGRKIKIFPFSLFLIACLITLGCAESDRLKTDDLLLIFSDMAGVNFNSSQLYKSKKNVGYGGVKYYEVVLSDDELMALLKKIENNKYWKLQPRRSSGNRNYEWERIAAFVKYDIEVIMKIKSNSRIIKIYLYPIN